jgi:hypothetical protein
VSGEGQGEGPMCGAIVRRAAHDVDPAKVPTVCYKPSQRLNSAKRPRKGVCGRPITMDEKKTLIKRLVADLNRDVPNLEATVRLVTIEAVEMAGFVQSSFSAFNSLLSSSLELFHRHSALGIYHTDATFFSRRALREALCSYYGAAGSLLRNACEAILRGAFWECLAHQRYRDRAEVVGEQKRKRKIEGTLRNVLDWMNDVFQVSPQLERPLEKESSGIFDRISPLFESMIPVAEEIRMPRVVRRIQVLAF